MGMCTDSHDTTEIMLKTVLNTIQSTNQWKKLILNSLSTINFRQVKIERIYRGQNKCDLSLRFVFNRIENNVGKGGWLPAFSPPRMFSKGFLYGVTKSRGCVVKG